MPDFCTLWPGGPLFRQSAHFPLCTDSVLLADFVRTASLRRGLTLAAEAAQFRCSSFFGAPALP